MRRRQLLAALGVSVGGGAGCLSTGDGSAGTTTPRPSTAPGTESATPRPTDTGTPGSTTASPSFGATEVQRRISLAGVDEVTDYPPAIDVQLVNGAVTGEDPARVRVTVTNEDDEARRLTNNEDGDCSFFNRLGGASDPLGLHLRQPGSPGIVFECADADRRGERWELDLSAETYCAQEDYGCTTVAYDAGESMHTTYQLWDHHTVEGYMRPDTYRFERDVTVGRFDDGEQFTWGFSLTVERPD